MLIHGDDGICFGDFFDNVFNYSLLRFIDLYFGHRIDFNVTLCDDAIAARGDDVDGNAFILFIF